MNGQLAADRGKSGTAAPYLNLRSGSSPCPAFPSTSSTPSTPPALCPSGYYFDAQPNLASHDEKPQIGCVREPRGYMRPATRGGRREEDGPERMEEEEEKACQQWIALRESSTGQVPRISALAHALLLLVVKIVLLARIGGSVHGMMGDANWDAVGLVCLSSLSPPHSLSSPQHGSTASKHPTDTTKPQPASLIQHQPVQSSRNNPEAIGCRSCEPFRADCSVI